MIEITIARRDGKAESSRSMQFADSAPFRTEVLPTLMKAPEFSCGSVLWIDTGCTCRRKTLPDVERPVMAPVRICVSGILETVSDLLEAALESHTLHVVNANGEGYDVSLKNTRDAAKKSKKDPAPENEPAAGSKVSPRKLTSTVASAGTFLSDLPGYSPRRVSSSL